MKNDNTIYHDFCSEFYNPKAWTEFKYQGCGFMEKLREWAKKWPSVKLISCDDACASGSLLVLFPVGKQICMISVPQNGDASELSVYPSEIIKAMEKMK